MGKASLAKKHSNWPWSNTKVIRLKLVQVEMLVYDDKLELAEKLNELYAIEPTNEEIYIQKQTSALKGPTRAVELLKTALKYTDDFADVYNLIGMEYLLWTILKWQKNSIKCLEEDLEDQSALYNIVYCFEF
jgi:hypothetical protein